MQFILSKVLLPFLLPLTWILVLLIWAYFTRSQKRRNRLLLVTVILFLVFSEPFIFNAYAQMWDYPEAELPPAKTYSCVIVLGGFSGEKKNGGGYFDIASDRFIQGVELLSTKKAKMILISSGDGSLVQHGFSEAKWVKGELKKMQIPDSLILIEGKSRNTIENALYSKKILEANHLAPPYLLVTSAFHMRRSVLIFEKAGLRVVPYPANYMAGIGRITYGSFIPSADTFARWGIYTKELVGYVVAKIRKF